MAVSPTGEYPRTGLSGLQRLDPSVRRLSSPVDALAALHERPERLPQRGPPGCDVLQAVPALPDELQLTCTPAGHGRRHAGARWPARARTRGRDVSTAAPTYGQSALAA